MDFLGKKREGSNCWALLEAMYDAVSISLIFERKKNREFESHYSLCC